MTREYSPAGVVEVPLNIMCSSTCATPVTPLTSSMLPTRYHTITTATGARRSALTMTRRPLASLCSAVSSAARHGAANVSTPSTLNAQVKCLMNAMNVKGLRFGKGVFQARIVSTRGPDITFQVTVAGHITRI